MSKPVAYAAVAADGSESVYVASLKEQAEACCRENGWFLLPLYAAPPTWQEEVVSVEAAFERSAVQPTWPADEAGNIGPMAAAMADEIGRLRVAIHSLAERDATLSVQGGSVTVTMDATVTDEEREAIEDAIKALSEALDLMNGEDSRATATLRNLLERLR
jgi:hypothetical protein